MESAEKTIEDIRAEMEASYEAARTRVSRRLQSPQPERLHESRRRARDLLQETRARALKRLAPEKGEETRPDQGPKLSLKDLHTLDRLLSYVRHSVVRLCFYNLKLFCPSLVDEYDQSVRDQVVENVDQLPRVRRELDSFFEQTLSEDRQIGTLFRENRDNTLSRLDDLIGLALFAKTRLDQEGVRHDFAARAPKLIDDVMERLTTIQDELSARKVSLADLVQEAVELTQHLAKEAGLELEIESKPAPAVFADEQQLTNALSELIMNAVKYSEGQRIGIQVGPVDDGQNVRIRIEDDGIGMNSKELARCLSPGVSKGGTGDGLPMVVQIIEDMHLGEFEITGKRGKGCTCRIDLPVKLPINQNAAAQRGKEND